MVSSEKNNGVSQAGSLTLSALVLREESFITNARRQLHALAEPSGAEFKTQAFLLDELKKLGISAKKAGTGIIADIKGNNRKNTVALRADMDALPLTEARECSFKAGGGMMHACGHDGHMAILLTVAKMLAENRPEHNVRLIFQPAEEGGGGAEDMILAGCLKNVSEIYALHLSPLLKEGEIASCPGALFAGVAEFDVTFKGKASHCAHKELGTDAIAAALSFMEKSRAVFAPFAGNCLFHLGKIEGGAARNIVADSCRLMLTFRYFTVEAREAFFMELARALVETDREYATEHTLKVHAVYPPLINDKRCYALAKSVVPGLSEAKAGYTAEDFAFYLEKAPGLMCWLGVGTKEYSAPLHSPLFGFNEKALLYGVQYFLNILDLCEF